MANSPALTTEDFNRILVVDDEESIRELLRDFLMRKGYKVQTARDGQEALETAGKQDFDLVVTDLAMPVMDGFALIKQLAKVRPLTTIIVLSGQDTFENAIEAVRGGAYDFVAKPVMDFDSFKLCIDRGLERKSLLLQKENYQKNLEEMVAEQTKELARANILLKEYAAQLEAVSVSVITSLLAVLEEKDRYTAGHSRRVTFFALEAGKRLNLTSRETWLLQTAAQLHDMGKLVIDMEYVNKPGPLTDEEWKLMKEHPATADRFLAPFAFLEDVRPIIRHHHERMDGTGYPDGLKGEEVDLLTQILAVADSYDAMTSRRSYREPMSMEDAAAELKKCIGRFWREDVVEAFLAYLAQSGGQEPEQAMA